MKQTIYLITTTNCNHTEGVWTSLDDILNWLGERFADCDEGGGDKTPLDEFMDCHWVLAYQDGEGSDHEIIKWTDIIPME